MDPGGCARLDAGFAQVGFAALYCERNDLDQTAAHTRTGLQHSQCDPHFENRDASPPPIGLNIIFELNGRSRTQCVARARELDLFA